MKKTFKYLMLALLLIPCALVFTACGNSSMSTKEFAKLIYEQQSNFEKDQDYASYKNIRVNAKQESIDNDFEDVTYKKGADETETTEKMPVTTKTERSVEISRTGKGEGTALKIVATTKTTETKTTVKADKTLGNKTVTTNSQTETYLFGKMGTENKFSVSHTKVVDPTKTTIDGAAQEPVSHDDQKVDEYYSYPSETEFQAAVETVVDYFISYSQTAGQYAAAAYTMGGEIIKKGNIVTSKVENIEVGISTSNHSYQDMTANVKYNGKNLAGVNFDSTSKYFNEGYERVTTITGSLEVDYNFSGTISLLSDFGTRTLGEGLSSLSLDELLEFQFLSSM